MQYQSPLPEEIVNLSTPQLARRIAECKEALGDQLVILGHHYQRDEVIAFADITGDSLKLAQAAAELDAGYIVFAGVHFMAESADILTGPEQVVCLPSFRAGCAMAEMADAQAVQAALEELSALCDQRIVPITYVNSTAAVKAVTARHGGSCCTSGNVRNVFSWALADEADGGGGAGKLFAVPDQHLARNTAVAMGYDESACAVYDPDLPDGGLDRQTVAEAKFLLWKGHCYVHQVFALEDIQRVRRDDPQARVIVHPECPRPVVQAADAAGSTQQIITAIDQAEPNSRWYVGTEGNLVNRLNQTHPDKEIRLLSDRPARCSQMAQIDLGHLLWVLEALRADRPVNRIQVDPEIARDARAAVQQMIDIPGVSQVTPSGESSAEA